MPFRVFFDTLLVACCACVVMAFASATLAQTVLIGSAQIRSQQDSNRDGVAEAFQAVASSSGAFGSIAVYIDSSSTASKVVVGLYADASGKPGTLLTQGSLAAPSAGGWNTVSVSSLNIVAGTRYWIAVLGPAGTGTVRFRDTSGGSRSETSAQTTLTSLPATWRTGIAYSDSPISAYGLSAAPGGPVLVVPTTPLGFVTTAGGADPTPQTLNVTNGGGGTLTFTATGDQSWLTVAPGGGTAPQSLQVTASAAGLTAGNYSGHVTVTAAGAQGSPATVPVSLSIGSASNFASDWPMVGHDPARSGYSASETVISPSTAPNLGLLWTANVDGKITAQPLFLTSVGINGQTHDVVLAATTQNSLYALDATTGAQLWRHSFGPDLSGFSPVPGGSGIRSAPLADRASGRIYVVTDDGYLHTVSIANGTESASPLQIIDLPLTNKVRGGLNLSGSSLYIANGSNGGDQPPWRGRIYRVDVSGSEPVLANTFDVVPSVTGDNRGGGIWGYAGVTVDPATGRVYAATGADQNESYTPYADRIVVLSPTLSLLGSYEPPHPSKFACSSAPCDQDFGATPILFQPDNCPKFVAAGNKSGDLYVITADALAASGAPWQSIKVNTSDDWLGNGGIGGVPAYSPASRMLYVTDAGTGSAGVKGGVSAFSVTAAPTCSLQLAWTIALPALGYAQSSPSVAGGVLFMGEGGSGIVHAYHAVTGVELWNSGSLFSGGTFAAPTIAGGKLFVGSWNGFAAADAGSVRAFAPGAVPPPPNCTPNPCVLLGDQGVESQLDGNAINVAEAFQATATSTGTANFVDLYLDGTSTSATVIVGLYADNAGHPGNLLGTGSTTQPVAGTWNKISISAVAVTQGAPYWLAVLGTQSGTVKFRDRSGGCKSETSASSTLTSLPATWTTGHPYNDCPLSAYATP